MTPTPIQSLWVDDPLRDALREYAYLKRTSMGKLVTAAVEDAGANPLDDSVLSAEDIPKSTRHLSVKMPDETWTTARDNVQAAGRSFNAMVRRRLIKLCQDEGLL